jgi:Dynein heavy chain, N-terminal region 2
LPGLECMRLFLLVCMPRLHGCCCRKQEVLDEWLKCQQGWVYLEPIFGSEDILQQMPNEGRKFRAVDTAWRRVMARAALSPELLSIAADDELLKTLLDCNKLLDQVNFPCLLTHHACGGGGFDIELFPHSLCP